MALATRTAFTTFHGRLYEFRIPSYLWLHAFKSVTAFLVSNVAATAVSRWWCKLIPASPLRAVEAPHSRAPVLGLSGALSSPFPVKSVLTLADLHQATGPVLLWR